MSLFFFQLVYNRNKIKLSCVHRAQALSAVVGVFTGIPGKYAVSCS